MNHLREISGHGLAVCDHFDAHEMLDEIGVYPGILGSLLSRKYSRALAREIWMMGNSFTNILLIARGETNG